LSGQGNKSKTSKFRREKRQAVHEKMQEEMAQNEADKSVLKLTEFVTVSELASMMGKGPTEIISTLMTIGIFASINQRLDAETLVMVAEEFGYTVEFVDAEVSQSIEEEKMMIQAY
jgi:translation initiation factor IF-2